MKQHRGDVSRQVRLGAVLGARFGEKIDLARQENIGFDDLSRKNVFRGSDDFRRRRALRDGNALVHFRRLQRQVARFFDGEVFAPDAAGDNGARGN